MDPSSRSKARNSSGGSQQRSSFQSFDVDLHRIEPALNCAASKASLALRKIIGRGRHTVPPVQERLVGEDLTVRITRAVVHRAAARFPSLMLPLKRLLGVDTLRFVYLKGYALRYNSYKLLRLAHSVEFELPLIVDPAHGVYVDANGILLNAVGTDRYFKRSAKEKYANEGDEMIGYLRAHGIEPRNIIDLGANCGEYTLAFLAHTQARVVAVEPSSENLVVLRDNIARARTPYDLTRLTLVEKAVAPTAGFVDIGVGQRGGNSIVHPGLQRERVVATTLLQIVADAGMTEVDLLKIDIEGAEPLIADDLVALAPRIRVMLIEMGGGLNDPREYERLTAALMDTGYGCYVRETDAQVTLVEAVRLLTEGHLDFFFRRGAPSALGTPEPQATNT